MKFMLVFLAVMAAVWAVMVFTSGIVTLVCCAALVFVAGFISEHYKWS